MFDDCSANYDDVKKWLQYHSYLHNKLLGQLPSNRVPVYEIRKSSKSFGYRSTMEMSRKNERGYRIILIDKHLLRNEKKELLYIQKYKIESQKTSFSFPVRKSTAFMFRIPLKSEFRFLSIVIRILGYESGMFLRAESSRFSVSSSFTVSATWM